MDIRDAALTVLDQLEQHLLKLRDDNQPVRLSEADAAEVATEPLKQLRDLASAKGALVDQGNEETSRRLIAEIRNLSDQQLIQRLAERDSTVICQREGHIFLGPAAGELRGSSEAQDENRPPQDEAFAPQLFRLRRPR